MKFDVEQQLKKVLDKQDRNLKLQFLAPNIPPFDIHLCCSNIRHSALGTRHKTCFKAFQSLELYLGYCVKKNCTVHDRELIGADSRMGSHCSQKKKFNESWIQTWLQRISTKTQIPSPPKTMLQLQLPKHSNKTSNTSKWNIKNYSARNMSEKKTKNTILNDFK